MKPVSANATDIWETAKAAEGRRARTCFPINTLTGWWHLTHHGEGTNPEPGTGTTFDGLLPSGAVAGMVYRVGNAGEGSQSSEWANH